MQYQLECNRCGQTIMLTLDGKEKNIKTVRCPREKCTGHAVNPFYQEKQLPPQAPQEEQPVGAQLWPNAAEVRRRKERAWHDLHG